MPLFSRSRSKSNDASGSPATGLTRRQLPIVAPAHDSREIKDTGTLSPMTTDDESGVYLCVFCAADVSGPLY